MVINSLTWTQKQVDVCSDSVGPRPTTVYLPSSPAKITEVNYEREKVAYTQSLGKTHLSLATRTLERSNTTFLIFFCECSLMLGTVLWIWISKSYSLMKSN